MTPFESGVEEVRLTLQEYRKIETHAELETALMNLLEWAKGNRGSKSGNPYCVPEVKAALRLLARIQGVSDWPDADTKGGTK